MRVELINGILPMLIFQNKTRLYTHSFFFVSFLENPDDIIEREHEKAVVKYNYKIVFLTVLIGLLSMMIHVNLMMLTMAVVLPLLAILYWSNAGEYHRDIKAYATSAKLASQTKQISLNDSIQYYSQKMIDSKKYGNFIESLGIERVMTDIYNNIEDPR